MRTRELKSCCGTGRISSSDMQQAHNHQTSYPSRPSYLNPLSKGPAGFDIQGENPTPSLNLLDMSILAHLGYFAHTRSPLALFSAPFSIYIPFRFVFHSPYTWSQVLHTVTKALRRCSPCSLLCSMYTLEPCAMRCCPLLFPEVPGCCVSIPVFAPLHSSLLSLVSFLFFLLI